MTYTLRPYQRGAVDAAIDHMRHCVDPALLELATGAGKSLIVSEVAIWLKDASGKKVLCLAPSKELVEQNAEKYQSYGLPASIWSASAGKKCMRNDVVFASPQSVKNSLERFGEQFSAVVIDEAHGITKTIKEIISHLKDCNPRLRVLGLTATPYRMNTGYIYAIDEDGNPIPDDECHNSYFSRLLYRVTANELIGMGYLTKPVADISDGYDTSGLEINRMGNFTAESVERAFEGHGRKTAEIVAQVVAAAYRRKGVMFFAATIEHAQEVMASLPPENSRLVTGQTKKSDRNDIIEAYKRREFKYLVNVAVLTTGFDAPHVDLVAILRATESPGLLQQIIGRGLRLCVGKDDCLVMDFAENIERHGLEDDLFDPDVKVRISNGGDGHVEAACPLCGVTNQFSARPNPDGYEMDSEGYWLDLDGMRIETDGGQHMPGHYGRRCMGQALKSGHYHQCDHRWSFKACPECDTENDIAARRCSSCKAELVDPNEKLRLDFKRMKRSPNMISTDKVVGWHCREWISKAGNQSLRVDYTTDFRTFPVWYSPDGVNAKSRQLWLDLCQAVFGRTAPDVEKFVAAIRGGHGVMPTTVTAVKQGDFFRVFAHNRPEDIEP